MVGEQLIVILLSFALMPWAASLSRRLVSDDDAQ
jgi:hypothetical protein